jgi:dihydrofolate reductase/thymidylate synthase
LKISLKKIDQQQIKHKDMKKFSVIGAMCKKNRGIGWKNTLPWTKTNSGKEDMKYFTKVTSFSKKNAVIMGRNTWESIPKKYRPLSGRHNFVVSRSKGSDIGKYVQGAWFFKSLDRTLDSIYNNKLEKLDIDNAFVIGGQQLYEEAIQRKDCEKIFLTEIEKTYKCDTFFPTLPPEFKVTKETFGKTSSAKFLVYQNMADPDSEEYRYLELLKEILKDGETSNDRTGTGIKSIFGKQLCFSIENGTIPLITTKKTFFRGIVEELLFFLRGEHDNRKLQEKNVHIWDGNTSREYLDRSQKQHIQTNDLGLAYGVQWRAAGAKLGDIDTDYRGKGIDQVANVIDLIKNNPTSRRMIINAWNVPQLKDMALVPCHTMYQFYVSQGKLSCMMTQRSADMFLGVPFNIASTATLTHILAKTTGLKTGDIIINFGNAHVYNNHTKQVLRQLERKPMKFPTLKINKELNNITDIEKLEFKDFELSKYHCHPGIKAQMAI